MRTGWVCGWVECQHYSATVETETQGSSAAASHVPRQAGSGSYTAVQWPLPHSWHPLCLAWTRASPCFSSCPSLAPLFPWDCPFLVSRGSLICTKYLFSLHRPLAMAALGSNRTPSCPCCLLELLQGPKPTPVHWPGVCWWARGESWPVTVISSVLRAVLCSLHLLGGHQQQVCYIELEFGSLHIGGEHSKSVGTLPDPDHRETER